MARTYSDVPEPRYVERAKYADNGGGGGGGEDELFWATYGKTPFAEIQSAYNAGKFCVLKIDDFTVTLTELQPDYIDFSTILNGGIQHFTCSENDGWEQYYEDIHSIYFVTPNSTSFIDIAVAMSINKLPVIKTLQGIMFYISDYVVDSGGLPTSVTFSTIGSNAVHTWTVDKQNNWTST